MRKHGLSTITAAFAAAAAVSRLTFRHVESRWQIACFFAAAALYEAASLQEKGFLRMVRLAVLCTVSAVSIVAVKAMLEPGAIRIAASRSYFILRNAAARGPHDPRQQRIVNQPQR